MTLTPRRWFTLVVAVWCLFCFIAATADDEKNDDEEQVIKTPKPPPRPKRNRQLDPLITASAQRKAERRAFYSRADGFANISFEEAVLKYEDLKEERLAGGTSQMSGNYKPILEDHHGGIELPAVPLARRLPEAPVAEDADCDPRENRFTPEVDRKCRAYMADPKNWRSIKPMSSILSAGRTLKFKLYFKNGAYAALKMNQAMFTRETTAELLSYTTDRVLGFNRVPPLVWVRMPVKYLKAAAATKGTFYCHWFNNAVLSHNNVGGTRRRRTRRHVEAEGDMLQQLQEQQATEAADGGALDEAMLDVTLQLWMSDIHNADETPMRPPAKVFEALDPNEPFPAPENEYFNRTLAEISDMSLFDMVVANTDRWFRHNIFVYGGCPTDCNVTEDKKIKGPPMYAYIDHGLTFMSRSAQRNLYQGAGYKSKRRAGGEGEDGGGGGRHRARACRFREATVHRLRSALKAEPSVASRIDAALNPAARRHIRFTSAKEAERRVRTVIDLIDSCEADYGAREVNAFHDADVLRELPAEYALASDRAARAGGERDAGDDGVARRLGAIEEEDEGPGLRRRNRRKSRRSRRLNGTTTEAPVLTAEPVKQDEVRPVEDVAADQEANATRALKKRPKRRAGGGRGMAGGLGDPDATVPAWLREQRRHFNSRADGFSNLTIPEALMLYDKNQELDVGNTEQNRPGFVQIYERQHAGIKLPDVPLIQRQPHVPVVDSPACDPRESRFTPEIDRNCQAYMGDPKNWKSIKPMSSLRSSGRTIKFKLYLKNGAIAALKLVQEKFVQEPMSELLAYATDRVLGFNRVPPMVWVSMPVKYLKAAAAAQDAFYCQWFHRAVLRDGSARRSIHDDTSVDPPERSVHVTLQLWMSDLHNADESDLRPPSSLYRALDAAETFPVAEARGSKYFNTSLAEFSDMGLFDYVIGNTDRWFRHNIFVYGGCSTECNVTAGHETLGSPRFAYIDHGLSFNRRGGGPRRNMYASGRRQATHACRFRASTVARLNAANTAADRGEASFQARVVASVPRAVFHLASREVVSEAERRLKSVVGMFDSCEEQFSRDAVRFFGGGLKELPSAYRDATLPPAEPVDDAEKDQRHERPRRRRSKRRDEYQPEQQQRPQEEAAIAEPATAAVGGGGGGGAEEETKPPALRRHRRGRDAFNSLAVGFYNRSFEETLQEYHERVVEEVAEPIAEQSRVSYKSILEDQHGGVRLPDTPIVRRRPDAPVAEDADCDPRDNRFTPKLDTRCRAYMADPKNWLSIKPMSSILTAGRTMKFKLYFKNGAYAALKLTQEKFIQEPASELLAFETDRALGFNRVPPLVWVGMPVKYLEAAAATKGTFYCKWFRRGVLEDTLAKQALHNDTTVDPPELAVYATLQLWMSDLHPASSTRLSSPPGFQRMLDASHPLKKSVTPLHRRAFAELVDMHLFDFIIGNTDRWVGHNYFVYGAGHDDVPEDERIRGEPAYAYIDHGLSFYNRGGHTDGGPPMPAKNLFRFRNGGEPSTKSCRFRGSTVERLIAAAEPVDGEPGYFDRMLARLPKGIDNVPLYIKRSGGMKKRPQKRRRRREQDADPTDAVGTTAAPTRQEEPTTAPPAAMMVINGTEVPVLGTPEPGASAKSALRDANARLQMLVKMFRACEERFGKEEVRYFADVEGVEKD